MAYQYLQILFSIIVSWGVILIIPGQDMVLVLQTTMNAGKKAAYKVVLGICLGLLVHILITTSGVVLILQKSPIMFNLIQDLGAVYLGYIGFKLIVSAWKKRSQLRSEEGIGLLQNELIDFKTGLLSTILNPKASIFFLSLFANIINEAVSNILIISASALIIMMTFIFYHTFISTLLLNRKLYEQLKNKTVQLELFSGAVLTTIATIILFHFKF